MKQCTCLTLVGKRCKNRAIKNDKKCGVHLNRCEDVHGWRNIIRDGSLSELEGRLELFKSNYSTDEVPPELYVRAENVLLQDLSDMVYDYSKQDGTTLSIKELLEKFIREPGTLVRNGRIESDGSHYIFVTESRHELFKQNEMFLRRSVQ